MFTEQQFLYQICQSQYFQKPNRSFNSNQSPSTENLFSSRTVLLVDAILPHTWLLCASTLPPSVPPLMIWINLHVHPNGYRGLWSIHEKLMAQNELLLTIKHLGKTTLWEWKIGIFILKKFVTPASLLVPKLKHITHRDNTSNVTSLLHINVLDIRRAIEHNDLYLFQSSKLEDISAKLKGEPVENFNNGNEAEAKAKSTKAPKPRDEVQPSHLRRSLKFWIKMHYTIR